MVLAEGRLDGAGRMAGYEAFFIFSFWYFYLEGEGEESEGSFVCWRGVILIFYFRVLVLWWYDLGSF